MMKKVLLSCWLVIYTMISSYSQIVNCVLEKDSIDFSDSVKVIIKNNSLGDVYFSIALEKQQSNNEWILYSRDVMTIPFSKLSVQIIVESFKEKIISFVIQEPEFFESVNGILSQAAGENLKIGNFRLIIKYGDISTKLYEFILLPLKITLQETP